MAIGKAAEYDSDPEEGSEEESGEDSSGDESYDYGFVGGVPGRVLACMKTSRVTTPHSMSENSSSHLNIFFASPMAL